jgi:hypothetical protein
LKWQCPPLTIDAVLMYAQRGPDSQSEYTFGLWRGEELLPVGKTSLGLSDTDQALLDAWIRAHTTNRFGPVREVERGIVLEVAFDTAQRSTRHKSGVALRSPRTPAHGQAVSRRRSVGNADGADSLKKRPHLSERPFSLIFPKTLLCELQIGRCFLAALHHHIVADLLPIIEPGQPGSLHGRDVYEHILAAALRLDEAETLGCIEPLNRTDSHFLVTLI